MSLTIRAYLHSFSSCCLSHLQNSAKFSEIRNYSSSRSSDVIDLVSNRNRIIICNFILVITSNFVLISCRFRDIDAFSSKVACFPIPPLFHAHSGGTPCDIIVIYTPWKVHLMGYNLVVDIAGLSSLV